MGIQTEIEKTDLKRLEKDSEKDVVYFRKSIKNSSKQALSQT